LSEISDISEEKLTFDGDLLLFLDLTGFFISSSDEVLQEFSDEISPALVIGEMTSSDFDFELPKRVPKVAARSRTD
jgi:hypothetical protein